MRKRYLLLTWALVLALVLASGTPYVGYLMLRNKLLAHHPNRMTHPWVNPDDYVNLRYFGWMGRLPNILNLAIWLANPDGTVYLPPGSYTQNVPFSLKSNLNFIGAGKGDTFSGCVTTINATLPSGDLFPVIHMNHIHMSDFCVLYKGSGANAAIHLRWGQFNSFERLFISGPFANEIQLNSEKGAASTIFNSFKDIHTTGTADSGVGCLLDSEAAVDKVINNNYFFNVNCTGGTNGIGLKIAGGQGGNPIVNENVFIGGQFTARNGTGIHLAANSVRSLELIAPDIEGSATGFYSAPGNRVHFIGGNIGSNTRNVADSSDADTIFLGTSVSGTLQTAAINPAGDLRINGIGINATPVPNSINGPAGWVLQGSGSTVAFINSNSLQLNRALDVNSKAVGNVASLSSSTANPAGLGTIRLAAGDIACWRNAANTADICIRKTPDDTLLGDFRMASFTFANLGTPANGTLRYCSDCTVSNRCAPTGRGALAKRISGSWVCN